MTDHIATLKGMLGGFNHDPLDAPMYGAITAGYGIVPQESAPPPPAEAQPAAADEALADTQRALIEAAERRGYERAKAERPAAVDEEMVERAAQALWDECTTGHRMMEKAGFPTDWPGQPESIKRDYRKRVRTVIAALAGQQGGV